MRLSAEYLRRHCLDVPVVEHSPNGSLVLRTHNSETWKSRWVILHLDWEPNRGEPGYYTLQTLMPNHNSYSSGMFFSGDEPLAIQWDEYEEFFTLWAMSLRDANPVGDETAVVLQLWEMFLYCYDGWFAKQPFEIKELIFDSIDLQRKPSERYTSYKDVLLYLTQGHPTVLRVWKYEFLIHSRPYLNWLATLVESKR